ncbi:oxygen-dependent coproporphyrinogen oxidase [Gemmatimonas sp.]|jgi:coproporphyrinogen III oxidase|uniref:oxygen-dependent coproporphyrinogen oxidase n=1 Tax=Gemmatimonas sp. TaxID=1962908 RepID=UPI0037C02B60
MTGATIAMPTDERLSAATPSNRRGEVIRWIAGLHDELTSFFGRLDRGGTFIEDRWERPGGGGGVARVMTDGVTFEKAGINRSAVMGVLPEAAARRLGGRGAMQGTTHFFATGVSLVIHPRSPKVPTVHLNVRYFELTDEHGQLTDCWFGGGTDLTPFYPHVEDAQGFHVALRDMCDRHHTSFYPRFKQWCDEYFVNVHRDNEARGVGGVFFDHLRAHEPSHGLDFEATQAFVTDVARVLRQAYEPIVNRRRHDAFNEAEREFQLVRRGRYVEFNLVHDRGTTFGLQTNARVESVLMSLPPVAMWHYAPRYSPDSFEARLLRMLEPRDWVADVAGA